MTVSQIFSSMGEAYFRKLEMDIVVRMRSALADKAGSTTHGSSLVLSVGGGLPAFEDNMAALLESGPVICLKASLDVLARRLRMAQERPLLKASEMDMAQSAVQKEMRAKLRKLLTEREKVYARAHHTVITDRLSVDEVVDVVRQLLSL